MEINFLQPVVERCTCNAEMARGLGSVPAVREVVQQAVETYTSLRAQMEDVCFLQNLLDIAAFE